MAKQSVQALLADMALLSESVHALVLAVRVLVQETFKTYSKEVKDALHNLTRGRACRSGGVMQSILKCGGILFAMDGLVFCGVFAYKQHVSVEFAAGATMTDSYGFLEGAGKGRRHIKLRAAADIRAQCVAQYLRLGWDAARARAFA